MAKVTKKEYTEYLNNYFAEQPFDWVVDRFVHLEIGRVAAAHARRKVGNLLRDTDPIGFNVGYRDYKLEKEYERENYETI